MAKKEITYVLVHPQDEEKGLDLFWKNLPEEYHEFFEVIPCDGSDFEIELNSEKIMEINPLFVFFVEEMNPRYGTDALYKYLDILQRQKKDDEYPILCHFDTNKKKGDGQEAITRLLDMYKNNPMDCIQTMIGCKTA